MRKFLLLLLLSFSHSFLYAIDYTVRGRVIEQQSRQPVTDAYVWLAGKDTLTTVTDSLGCFTLEQVLPRASMRYRLKPIKMESGNLVPTLGLTAEF